MSLSRAAAFILLGLSIYALGFGAAAGLVLLSAAEPQRFIGPGETRIRVLQSGPRELWLFQRSDPGKVHPELPTVEVSVRSADGKTVVFERAREVATVMTRNSRRCSVGHFHFPSAGEYFVRIDAPQQTHDYSLTDSRRPQLVAEFALGTICGLIGAIGSTIWLVMLRPPVLADPHGTIKPSRRRRR